MNNVKLYNNLKNYKESNGILISIKALTSEFFSDVKELEQDEIRDRMQELLKGFIEYDLVNTKNLKSAMEGINQSLVGNKERELYELLDRQDELARKIKLKQDEIRNKLKISFENAELIISQSEIECKDEALGLLNNAIMKETRMLWILKESSQNAFLTTIENGININDTINQISKNMTFSAINEGEFTKGRIIEISKTIINSAIEVANEGHIFSKDLILGAVLGSKDGIGNSIELLKDKAKFAPDELKLNDSLRELQDIDENFINMLKDIESKVEAPAKEEIKRLLETSLDNNIAKLKRLSEQASEQIGLRIDELKSNPNINELINNTYEKMEKLKIALDDKSKILSSDINISEKLSSIKKEIEELEKKTNDKFGEIKQINITKEAKKIGDRAYKAAKEFLDTLKKDKN